MRLTNAMIQAALANLSTIMELAQDNDGKPTVVYRFHAHSANNSLAVLAKAKWPVPESVQRNANHLRCLVEQALCRRD